MCLSSCYYNSSLSAKLKKLFALIIRWSNSTMSKYSLAFLNFSVSFLLLDSLCYYLIMILLPLIFLSFSNFFYIPLRKKFLSDTFFPRTVKRNKNYSSRDSKIKFLSFGSFLSLAELKPNHSNLKINKCISV